MSPRLRRTRQPSIDWTASSREDLSRWEAVAKAPWIEAALSITLGFVLLALGKRQVAELTWIVGVALSFSRYAYERKLQEEMRRVHRLAEVVDLQQQVPSGQFQSIVTKYLEITEPEFRSIKDAYIGECVEKLSNLAQLRTSGELSTGDYFNWLFPVMQGVTKGSNVWAVSMMLDIEWEESATEDTFLELNLAAAEKEAVVERIFVVRQDEVSTLLSNPYIKGQFDAAGDFLVPLVVEREFLERHDPTLLTRLGDGLIGVDRRVVLVDISSPEGYRGYVVMEYGEIRRLRKLYDNLRVYARPMREAIEKAKKT